MKKSKGADCDIDVDTLLISFFSSSYLFLTLLFFLTINVVTFQPTHPSTSAWLNLKFDF